MGWSRAWPVRAISRNGRPSSRAVWCSKAKNSSALTRLEQEAITNVPPGATMVATANPGCHLQIARGLRDRGDAVGVSHPVSLLARAYRLEDTSDLTQGNP